MNAQAISTVKHKESYSFKKALVNGTVAACVVTSSLGVVGNFHNTKPKRVKPLIAEQVGKSNQISNIINVTPISYTKPKSYAEPYVIKRVYLGENLMKGKETINESYFTQKVTDFLIPKEEEEFIAFPKKFGLISEDQIPQKYNYSFDEVTKDFDYTSNKNDPDTYEL
jgi:F0F1-type ATP synthase gamma subunit